VQKTQYHKYKALTMVRVNQSVLSMLLSMCFTVRHGKRLGETLKLTSMTFWSSRDSWESRKRQSLVSVSAQKISCTSLRLT